MYHDYISRKPKRMEPKYNFDQDKDQLLEMVTLMIQPNASINYPRYHIYKDLFSEFTFQLIHTEKQLNEKHVTFDISNDFIEEYKKIIVKEKTILDLYKNKNIIYEKDV